MVSQETLQDQLPSVLWKVLLYLGLVWSPVQKSKEQSQQENKSQLLLLTLKNMKGKPTEGLQACYS